MSDLMTALALLAEAFDAAADAASYIDPCAACGAGKGEPCHIINHPDRPTDPHRDRMPGDETLATSFRAMAATIRSGLNGRAPLPTPERYVP